MFNMSSTKLLKSTKSDSSRWLFGALRFWNFLLTFIGSNWKHLLIWFNPDIKFCNESVYISIKVADKHRF